MERTAAERGNHASRRSSAIGEATERDVAALGAGQLRRPEAARSKRRQNENAGKQEVAAEGFEPDTRIMIPLL